MILARVILARVAGTSIRCQNAIRIATNQETPFPFEFEPQNLRLICKNSDMGNRNPGVGAVVGNCDAADAAMALHGGWSRRKSARKLEAGLSWGVAMTSRWVRSAVDAHSRVVGQGRITCQRYRRDAAHSGPCAVVRVRCHAQYGRKRWATRWGRDGYVLYRLALTCFS